MYQLLQAYENGTLDIEQLKQSQMRQQRILNILDNGIDET